MQQKWRQYAVGALLGALVLAAGPAGDAVNRMAGA